MSREQWDCMQPKTFSKTKMIWLTVTFNPYMY